MASTSLCLSAGFNVFTFRLTLTSLQSDVFVPVEVVAVVIVVEVVVVVVEVVMIGEAVVMVVAGPVTLLLSAESENIKFR